MNERSEQRSQQWLRFRHPGRFMGEESRQHRRDTATNMRSARRARTPARPRSNIRFTSTFDARAHEQMLANPEYQYLARMARAGGAISVSTRTDHQRAGMWNGRSRELTLGPNLPGPQRVSVMAFELTNAAHQPKSDRLTNQALAGRIGQEEFAQAAESLEYQGVRWHHSAMSRGVHGRGWPQEMDRWRERFSARYIDIDSGSSARGDWRTFWGYWESQKRTGHAAFHRNRYDSAQHAAQLRQGMYGFAAGNHALQQDQNRRGGGDGAGGSAST